MSVVASTETYVYYRDDGFLFRHPAPRSLTTIREMEVWDDGSWSVTGLDVALQVAWDGRQLTQAQADAMTGGTATHLTANREG